MRIKSGRCGSAAATPLLAVLGLQDLKAGTGEQIAQDLPVVFLILHHQYSLAHTTLAPLTAFTGS